MFLEVSQYTLTAKASLNNLSHQKRRHGALLRITFDDGLIGHADCHPWVELGDYPLAQQLNLLKKSEVTPLTKQSIRFARLDAEARANKKNLLEDCSIPPSHYLINDLENIEIGLLENLKNQGFSHLKIKMGRNVPKEICTFKELAASEIGRHFMWRFDFNGQLTYQASIAFLEKINPCLKLIDFIEDIIPFCLDQWASIQKNFGVSLACDHRVYEAIGFPEAAKVLILKPAICNENDFSNKTIKDQRLIVTSYLDHPLGQCCAAYVASKVSPYEHCGLLSHQAYERNLFSDFLSVKSSNFIKPPGFGLGFNHLLDEETWNNI